MPNLTAIAGGPLAVELTLAGIRVEETKDPREAEAILERLLRTPTQLVVVEEQLARGFSAGLRARLKRHRGRPLIVYCPAFDEGERDVTSYVAAFITPAVGYEIRLD